MTTREYADPQLREYIAVEADSLPAQRQALAQQYRQRQGLPARTVVPPGSPQYAPADQRSFFGRPKESKAVKQNNARLQAMHLTEQRTEYAQHAAVYLEYRGFVQATLAAAGMETVLLRYDPDSLTFAFASTILLDSFDRLRTGMSNINETAADAIRGLI